MDDAGNESATEQEMEAPSNEISMEEAMRLKEEKKKAVAALAKTGPTREVDTSAFASMAAPKKLEDEENHLDMLKVDAKFRKRGEKEVKAKQTLDLNFKVAPTDSPATTMTDATVDVTAVDVTVTVATKAKVGVDAVVTVAEVAEAVILAAAEATILVAAAAEAAEAPTSTLQITLLSHLWVK